MNSILSSGDFFFFFFTETQICASLKLVQKYIESTKLKNKMEILRN